ncbi:predicted protein [Postia placenta Mad-698-R]|uniref:Uncharacterized protein n=1 Tax=Postia placenta MAD-698-R-SB12 TaxID=670580 RepID=A0A1X6N3X7_9APHY|nr:hypothetical protein POSPLADRAFT_1140360 [Postia placenta MAD-698-R-SB12]EED85831.1 predicted protein [Postia placenta Mad-698-R]OSX63186.1 hypothetical protein POSPLADRAFT_1140360 [Postia placenta MAD-698-R-SB12]
MTRAHTAVIIAKLPRLLTSCGRIAIEQLCILTGQWGKMAPHDRRHFIGRARAASWIGINFAESARDTGLSHWFRSLERSVCVETSSEDGTESIRRSQPSSHCTPQSNTQNTPWHWEIVVKTNPWVKGTGQAVGEAFHIKGATQAIFTYERKQNVKYGSPSSFKGCVLVGHINATALDAADQLLSTVPIVNGNHNWNCQNWVVLAISALENQGRAFFKLNKGRPVKQVDLLAKMVPLATAYDAVVQSEDEL